MARINMIGKLNSTKLCKRLNLKNPNQYWKNINNLILIITTFIRFCINEC